jgi:hypothetical protein
MSSKKFQVPNSKLQRSSKFQTPRQAFQVPISDLEVGTYLEVGTWSLELSVA